MLSSRSYEPGLILVLPFPVPFSVGGGFDRKSCALATTIGSMFS